MNSSHGRWCWLWRPNPPNLPWALGRVELTVCQCIHGPCQSLYIEGGRFMGVKSDLEVLEGITMWGGSRKRDFYMRRSVRTRVVVKLQAIRCLRVVQYRPRFKYCIMQYKWELAFSLYCIIPSLLSTSYIGSWTRGVVHEELPPVLLPPRIVVKGPLSWVGLTVAVSRILKMDKWFIIFMGTRDWFDSACPGRWWIVCLSKFCCLINLRWELDTIVVESFRLTPYNLKLWST